MATNIVPGEFIVTLRPYATGAMRTAHNSRVSAMTEDSNSPFHCDVRHEFEFPELRGYSAKFDEATKAQLEEMSEVASIEPVQIYKHCSVVQNDAPWGLARISARKKILATGGSPKYKYDNTGEGSIAYVIDTGINEKHEEFEGRASKGPKFVTSNTSVSDEDTGGHGTHVAGTIAGKTYGVAKKAEVVGIKVFGDGEDAGASTADIIKALEYVVTEFQNHGKPSVVNMSLGGGPSLALDQAVAGTVRSGIVVCVAAGNNGRPAHLGSPSREPLAITVGVSDINDEVPSWGSFGKVVDIIAPGVNILSTWIGNVTATNTISGTSMACPHVTGAVCSMLGSQKMDPLLVMPQLLLWADKNKLTGLRDRTIDALLQVSDAS